MLRPFIFISVSPLYFYDANYLKVQITGIRSMPINLYDLPAEIRFHVIESMFLETINALFIRRVIYDTLIHELKIIYAFNFNSLVRAVHCCIFFKIRKVHRSPCVKNFLLRNKKSLLSFRQILATGLEKIKETVDNLINMIKWYFSFQSNFNYKLAVSVVNMASPGHDQISKPPRHRIH